MESALLPMRKSLFIVYLALIYFLLAKPAHAIVNPLSVPNNKIGIHILFDSELPQAARLINSSGGDWGYVTIPIQWGDKDLVKWQNFMNNCRRYHVIPILRLATEGDFFNTTVWRKPLPSDIMDFANFLDSLDWPVKNRYIIIYNEVNRGDEWGGQANPQEYANLLSFAVTVFKSKSPDFFIISAGLDNAAPNLTPTYFNEYDYMKQMNAAVPGIFNQIDGLSSHSYPNPGFSQPPSAVSAMGTSSFLYEQQLAKNLSNKTLPVFITETGWSTDSISDDLAAHYYQTTFASIWNDPSIVAITPFLLQGWGSPFQQFSLLNGNGSYTKQYQFLHDLPKTHGYPVLAIRVLAAETHKETLASLLPSLNFSKDNRHQRRYSLVNITENVFNWLIGK